MKIKWKPRLHKNKDDCWNDALAFALNKSYDEVRRDCKAFIKKDDGGLESRITIGILLDNDYTHYELGKYITVSEFFRFHNTYNNHCVLAIITPQGSHIVYVHKNIIYDNEPIEYRGQYYDYEVREFLMKASD
jgi:hypothetical protein